MLNLIRLAGINIKRDLRSGDWLLIFIATILAVASLTSLKFFTDRIQNGIANQSARLLGGHLVIVSNKPIRQSFLMLAKKFNLKFATVASYPSMISANDRFQLVNIQAVSDTYPVLSEENKRPLRGQVWVQKRVLSSLHSDVGNKIKIGSQFFIVNNELTSELDALNTGVFIAPRVMMTLNDAIKSGTILPESRIEYRLLLAGQQENLQQFANNAKKNLNPHERLVSLNNQKTFLSEAIRNIENYFILILVIILLMASSVILICASAYLRKHYQNIALWRCLGASSKQILWILVLQIFYVAFFAGLIGMTLGYFAQNFFVVLFNQYIPFTLPHITLQPLYYGTTISFILLFSFSLPAIIQLSQVSPLSIWQGRSRVKIKNQIPIYFLILAWFGFIVGVFLLLSAPTIFLLLLSSVSLSIAFLYLFSLFLFKILKYLSQKLNGVLRRGIGQILQFQDSASLQFICFSLIISMLIALVNVQNYLTQTWQSKLPPGTPNFFIFNMASTDVPKIKNLLSNNNIKIEHIYPMVRGRMVALNDVPIMEAIPAQARTHNALFRELNLTFTDHYPADNQIVRGQHWGLNETKAYVSVESDLANQFRIQLGDKLSFQIGDEIVTAVTINHRKVEWTSFHPNFYIIFPNSFLTKYNPTYITSFYLSEQNYNLINELLQQFPNLTIIDIANILEQISIIIKGMALAITYLFIVCLIIAILVFLSSLYSNKDERRSTKRLLTILGASPGYIYKSDIIEFGTLFSSIFLISCVFGNLLSNLILQRIFIV